VQTSMRMTWAASAEGCRSGLLDFCSAAGVSDNLTQGLEGGCESRLAELDCELSRVRCDAHCYDAMVGLHHCDKNGPGFRWLWRE